MKSTIAIITVLYNNYQILEDFIASLQNQTNKDWFLYIVDLSDNNKKHLPDIIDNLINNKKCLIINNANKGYAYGVNLGLRQALADGYHNFAVVNSDTIFDKDFTKNAQASLIKYPSAIIGGKIYYVSGFEYHKERYQKKDRGKVIWYAGGDIDWNNVYTKHRGVDEVDNNQYNKFQETGFITGCLVVFDKSVIDKIGFWNESFFLYFEDADWGERAKKVGIKLYYDPKIIIWHKNAQSTGGSGSILHQRYQTKNRIRFGLKYASLRVKLHLLINYFVKL